MTDTKIDLSPTKEEQDTNVSEFDSYFAPGVPAEIRNGVLYQVDYQNEADGTGIAGRLHARALHSSGVPVLVKAFTSNVQTSRGTYEPMHVVGIPENVYNELKVGDNGHLTTTSISGTYPVIRHFVIYQHEDISKRVMRGATGVLDNPETLMKARKSMYASTVMFSVWERDRVDDATVRELNRMGDNWVPCEQNAKMLRKSGVDRVYVMPHPFDPNSPMQHLIRRKPMKTKRFYNIGRWEPRKGQVKLMFAFFESFKPGDDVHLTIKCHGQWDNYPSPQEVIEKVLERGTWSSKEIDEHFTLIDHHVPANHILKLHFENNIYVAPSSGEAWCLPAFEAKVAGNRVVHTPYGGTADFCDEEDVEIAYDMRDVPSSYGWTPGCQWAGLEIRDVSQALIDVNPPSSYSRADEFEARFSLEAIGKRMRARLAEHFGDTINGGYLK